MDNTDKVVDLLIELKREICEKYYDGIDCCKIDCYGKLHWCPMAYDEDKGRYDFCQINDIINLITENEDTLDD